MTLLEFSKKETIRALLGIVIVIVLGLVIPEQVGLLKLALIYVFIVFFGGYYGPLVGFIIGFLGLFVANALYLSVYNIPNIGPNPFYDLLIGPIVFYFIGGLFGFVPGLWWYIKKGKVYGIKSTIIIIALGSTMSIIQFFYIALAGDYRLPYMNYESNYFLLDALYGNGLSDVFAWDVQVFSLVTIWFILFGVLILSTLLFLLEPKLVGTTTANYILPHVQDPLNCSIDALSKKMATLLDSNGFASPEDVIPDDIMNANTKMKTKVCKKVAEKLATQKELTISTTGVVFTKDFFDKTVTKAVEEIKNKKAISVKELSNALQLPNKDIQKFLIPELLKHPAIVVSSDKKMFYSADHLVEETNKLGKVYTKVEFKELANKLKMDEKTLKEFLTTAIANGKISARISDNTLLFAVEQIATPTTPPVQAPTQETLAIPGYRIENVIGSGGFATVFKAIDSEGREVALKVITNVDPETKKTFVREVSLWKVLQHPNIVKLYDFCDAPVPFIAMELMKDTLRNKLATEKKLSPKEAVSIIRDIAMALNYAHKDYNIVHRDIKPENILISREGIYKLSDWGLASMQILMGQTTGYKGTLVYSAPEQFDPNFGKIGPWTDVWQLGAVFYELIAGEPPFGLDPAQVVNKVLKSDLAPITGVPKELNELIQKMLQKKPTERITMEEVIKELQAVEVE